MELTTDQKLALFKLTQWYRSSKQVFTMHGYAGTGKSFLISKFTEEMELLPGEYSYVAFTGKAVNVLNSKGVPAITFHRLLYDYSGDDENGEPTFIKKSNIGSVKLVIIDEYSMISKDLFNDLLSYNVRIILVGDPGQLQPINGEAINIQEPDVELTKIMRQAEDSPILKLATDARLGKPLGVGFLSPEVGIISRSEIPKELLLDRSYQIIVGYNNTRSAVNKYIRNLNNIDSPIPLAGEKIISIVNKWSIITDSELPLVNGLICDVITSEDVDDSTVHFKLKDASNTDMSKHFSVTASKAPYYGSGYFDYELPAFDYAYAITCHKAQGSEFNNVVLYHEPIGDYNKWLYTGITRAKSSLIIAL